MYEVSKDLRGFKQQVREFLRENPELNSPRQFFCGRGGTTRKLYQAMGERGWLSLAWPREFGGLERSPSYEYVLWDELAYARAARPDLAAGIVAKTLITHGTRDQQDRYLPGISRGDVAFALGYSEPEAGSDLAAVRTRAVRDGDHYQVSGEKRWTSDAHNSRYLWTICRTGDPEARSRGLTLLIVDLEAEGVTIRPIPTIDGHQLNEVFLDEVVVPVAERVGDDGEAWSIIREALAVERHLMLLPGRLRRDFEDLVAWSRLIGHYDDPVWKERLVQFTVAVSEVEALALSTVDAIESGEPGVVEAARTKLAGSELAREIPRAAVALGDARFLFEDNELEFLWRESVMETIAGGTSEIMRGVIARTQLGLGAKS